MLQDMLVWKVGVCMLAALAVSRGHTFVSMREMEQLFDTEQALVAALNNYVKNADFELAVLKARNEHHSKVKNEIKDAASYSKNPVNAYALVKRLVNDWPATFKLMDSTSMPMDPGTELPDQSVLPEMLTKLVEWQEQMKLNTQKLARGQVEGILPHAVFRAKDCYDIAVLCYHTKRYGLAVEWLRETGLKITQGKDFTASLISVTEYTFLTKCILGDLKGSVEAYEALIKYGHELYVPSKVLSEDYKLPEVEKCKDVAANEKKKKDFEVSSDICSGNVAPVRTRDQLDCVINDINNPYLKIQPLKTEDVSAYPNIILIHDILTDNEINQIKQSFLNQVPSLSMGHNGPISLADLKLNKILDIKSGYMTNFDVKPMADPYSVTVSGPGGSYQPFDDFSSYAEGSLNDRPRKLMYFLSDVAQGGYTVFPTIRVTVTPKKGSVLLWAGPLTMMGETAETLARGECPVLAGVKWAITKTVR